LPDKQQHQQHQHHHHQPEVNALAKNTDEVYEDERRRLGITGVTATGGWGKPFYDNHSNPPPSGSHQVKSPVLSSVVNVQDVSPLTAALALRSSEAVHESDPVLEFLRSAKNIREAAASSTHKRKSFNPDEALNRQPQQHQQPTPLHEDSNLLQPLQGVDPSRPISPSQLTGLAKHQAIQAKLRAAPPQVSSSSSSSSSNLSSLQVPPSHAIHQRTSQSMPSQSRGSSVDDSTGLKHKLMWRDEAAGPLVSGAERCWARIVYSFPSHLLFGLF
jgi:hypothetical protein